MEFSGFSVAFASTEKGRMIFSVGDFSFLARHLFLRRFIFMNFRDHINLHVPAQHRIMSLRIFPKP